MVLLSFFFCVVFSRDWSFRMDCPRCHSSHFIKDGISDGRQRYECKQCQYHYTVEKRSNERSLETRQLALNMYLEGLGFRAIGRLFSTSVSKTLAFRRFYVYNLFYGSLSPYLSYTV